MIDDAPWIRRCEATGYASPPDFGRSCPLCGAAIGIGDRLFVIDGLDVCRECFKDWLDDFFFENPQVVADALDIRNSIYRADGPYD